MVKDVDTRDVTVKMAAPVRITRCALSDLLKKEQLTLKCTRKVHTKIESNNRPWKCVK